MSAAKLSEGDFPSLFQAADTASVKAQNSYTLLVRMDLILTVLGALLSSLPAQGFNEKSILNIFGVIVLAVAFIISLALRWTRFERTWYGGRAVAESVKSLSWLYMTGAKPFLQTLGSQKADKLFADRLGEIMVERKNLAFDFTNNLADQISKAMSAIRQGSLDDRKTRYVNERIREQRAWYSSKSGFNRKRAKLYFGIALSFQAFAFIWAILLIRWTELPNLVGVIAAITTALFSWMQIRKFQELAQVYALTAQELGLVEAKSSGVTTETHLSSFVSDAENAISREHTLWIARRDH